MHSTDPTEDLSALVEAQLDYKEQLEAKKALRKEPLPVEIDLEDLAADDDDDNEYDD